MTKDVLSDFSSKTLSIDCHRLTLRQLREGGVTYEGCGTISQSLEGRIRLKAFVSPASASQSHADRIATVFRLNFGTSKAGELIPDEDHFELVAHAINGHTWICNRFLPHFETTFATDGVIVSGELWRIKACDLVPDLIRGEDITLHYRNKVDFPCNVLTRTETVSGDRKGWSSKWDTACFTAANLEFRLDTTDSVFHINAYSNSQLPSNIEARISETCSFVFATEFTPFAVSMGNSEGRTLTLFSEREAPLKPAYRPLNCGFHDPTDSFWHLFDCYLRHILTSQVEHWHPLSSHVISVIRAREGSLDALALTLAIAIEGVLKSEFCHISPPTQETLRQAEAALQLVESSDLNDGFKRRLRGLIGGTKSARPIDKLHNLAELGVVRSEFIGVWKKMRDTHAHAAISTPEIFAARLRSCQIVRTLLHELIFEAIRYEGSFTDYSVLGWPIATRKRASPE